VPGILDYAGLAVAVAFAAPLALFGATTLAGGDLLGLVYLGLAALVVGVRHAVTTPSDLPTSALSWVADRVAKPPEDD
jgi:hypothetical protein